MYIGRTVDVPAMNSRRLDDLLAGEDTPGDGIGSLRVGVGSEVAVLVDGVVGDVRVPLDPAHKVVEQRRRDKELEVRLLVDVTVLGPPSVRLVVRSGTVDAAEGGSR